jgi:hypothetical protein
MHLDLKIDIVPSISKRDFEKNYLRPQKPLLIRKGIVNEQPAGTKWSLDWFKKNYGNVLVDVYDNGNDEHKKSAVVKPDLKMRFDEFISVIQKDEYTGLRMFLFNLYKIQPELKKDFACPPIIKGVLGNIGYTFFGGKNTDVKMHYDIDMSNVMLTQFEGKKRVILFEPKYSTLLYRLPFNQHNVIDIIRPDYQKYPGLRYVRGYDFIMEPGDTLFMPSGYWHYNTYLEGGFAVAYRKLASSLATKLHGARNLFLIMPFDKLMLALFKDKWFQWKVAESERRANEVVNQIENGMGLSGALNY